MFPVLFQYGPVHAYSYGLCLIVAVVLGFGVLGWMVARLRLPVAALAVASIAVPEFLVGAKLGYFLYNVSACSSDPLGCLVHGGLVFFPGAVLAVLSTLLVVLVLRLPLGGTFDAMAVALLASASMGRVGCFLAGCCFGRASTLPWAVRFPPNGLMPPELQGVAVHPLQLYLAGSWALLVLLLAWRARTRRFPGELALEGLCAFGMVSIGDHYLRWNPAPSLAPVILWAFVATACAVLIAMLAAVRR
jgi:phosphatidylglycerol---prolipoprotein diacylglyceryl transferase